MYNHTTQAGSLFGWCYTPYIFTAGIDYNVAPAQYPGKYMYLTYTRSLAATRYGRRPVFAENLRTNLHR